METSPGFENPTRDGAENRDRQADVLLRFLDVAKNIEPLHGQKFETVFSDEEHKREFLNNLTAEEFTELLNGVNGILRAKNKEEWGMDGENVVMEAPFIGTAYVPPRQEDKVGLLAEALNSAKEMNKSGRGLKDIALLISSSLNAIHPFVDANGRTSRLIYLLLTKDFNDETISEIEQSLSLYGRDKVDVNPHIIQSKIVDIIERRIGIKNLEKNPDNVVNLNSNGQDLLGCFNDGIAETDKKLLIDTFETDSPEFFLSVFKYLQTQEDKDKYIVKKKHWASISFDELIGDLKQEDVSQILQNYRNIKKEYVEIMIDCIAHPDKEEYQIEHDGQRVSLKDYFETIIREKAEKIAEEEREIKEKREAILRKESDIKERFNQGEGEYRMFESAEIDSIREAGQAVLEIVAAEKVFETENKECSDEQKLDFLKKSLFSLAGKINSQVSFSQDRINAYVENNKAELLDFFAQYHAVEKVMEYLENSGAFDYRINVSRDLEIPFYFPQDSLDKREDISFFLKDLFSQSVYYVSPSGVSVRLKLFEVKLKNMEAVVQPAMEQIFFSDEGVDYADKEVVKVSSRSPEQKNFVFEISTPGFRQHLLGEKNEEEPIRSGVGTISDEGGIYIDIPEGTTLHSGWRVVEVEKLKRAA